MAATHCLARAPAHKTLTLTYDQPVPAGEEIMSKAIKNHIKEKCIESIFKDVPMRGSLKSVLT